MREPFPHDIRAIMAAPGKGLSLKKITATTVFLLLGYLFFVICTYLALLYDGVRFEYIWQMYGLFPLKFFPFDALTAAGIQFAGLLLALMFASLAIMAGAVINFEEIRGNYFYGALEAVRFAFSRLPVFLLGYAALAAFVVCIYVLGLLAGLFGRLPVVGEVAIGLFYLVPIFITLIFIVFIIFVAVVSVVLFPVVIAAQREKELFGPLLHLFSVVIKEPVRFFGYLAVNLVLAKVASFILAYFVYRTVQLSQLILVTGGGKEISRLFYSAYSLLPLDSQAVKFVSNIFPGFTFGFSFSPWGVGGDASAGAILLAVSLFLLFAFVVGYMVSVLSTGLARGYVVIRRLKDDYFITQEESMVDNADYANPPLTPDNQDSR